MNLLFNSYEDEDYDLGELMVWKNASNGQIPRVAVEIEGDYLVRAEHDGGMYPGIFKLHTATSRTYWHWSVCPSVSLSVTLFCHNLNLRIDLRIDPANQK